jgi:RNA polymerase sigma-70 factor (ECF subfamily)
LSALENVTDERLLIEAAQRDPRQFAELYELNFERVYGFISRRVQDRDQAEELTAEVFHQALENLGRFQWRGAPFVAWLLRIAANAIADRWHRSAREPQLFDDAPEGAAEDDVERRVLLSRLLDTLPPDQRQVLVLRFINQRSAREIAAEMQRSEGAITQLQFRALASLRKLVGNHHG